MQPQEIFDTVVRHLAVQGRRAIARQGYGGCAYRGDNGTKCAAGVLIPDEKYDPGMEGSNVYAVADRYRLALPEWFAPNVDLIFELQGAHDFGWASADDPTEVDNEKLARTLCTVAKNNRLNDLAVTTAFAAN